MKRNHFPEESKFKSRNLSDEEISEIYVEKAPMDDSSKLKTVRWSLLFLQRIRDSHNKGNFQTALRIDSLDQFNNRSLEPEECKEAWKFLKQ